MKIVAQIKVIAKFLLKPFIKSSHLVFTGPYPTWMEAENNSAGYDSAVVVEKVELATRRVLEGKAKYERDGTAFKVSPKKNSLRDVLKEIAKNNHTIIDFGGGLGGTYLSNRDLLEDRSIKYVVVEQEIFSDVGRRIASDFNLPISFTESVKFSGLNHADVVILSSVIQYLGDWRNHVNDLLSLDPNFVIIDRTPLTNSSTEIYVQENEGYYSTKVSYACWSLNKAEVVNYFEGYELIKEWPSDFDPEGYSGLLLKKK